MPDTNANANAGPSGTQTADQSNRNQQIQQNQPPLPQRKRRTHLSQTVIDALRKLPKHLKQKKNTEIEDRNALRAVKAAQHDADPTNFPDVASDEESFITVSVAAVALSPASTLTGLLQKLSPESGKALLRTLPLFGGKRKPDEEDGQTSKKARTERTEVTVQAGMSLPVAFHGFLKTLRAYDVYMPLSMFTSPNLDFINANAALMATRKLNSSDPKEKAFSSEMGASTGSPLLLKTSPFAQKFQRTPMHHGITMEPTARDFTGRLVKSYGTWGLSSSDPARVFMYDVAGIDLDCGSPKPYSTHSDMGAMLLTQLCAAAMDVSGTGGLERCPRLLPLCSIRWKFPPYPGAARVFTSAFYGCYGSGAARAIALDESSRSAIACTAECFLPQCDAHLKPSFLRGRPYQHVAPLLDSAVSHPALRLRLRPSASASAARAAGHASLSSVPTRLPSHLVRKPLASDPASSPLRRRPDPEYLAIDLQDDAACVALLRAPLRHALPSTTFAAVLAVGAGETVLPIGKTWTLMASTTRHGSTLLVSSVIAVTTCERLSRLLQVVNRQRARPLLSASGLSYWGPSLIHSLTPSYGCFGLAHFLRAEHVSSTGEADAGGPAPSQRTAAQAASAAEDVATKVDFESKAEATSTEMASEAKGFRPAAGLSLTPPIVLLRDRGRIARVDTLATAKGQRASTPRLRVPLPRPRLRSSGSS
ncbi:hypothetical protein B0H15DRAFT_942376 [Mycena belliarum]|uniref:Uncharacterized protein n=1 Tax=Mycena belliarum TaxID=1033014 RepID=A0AAD6Y0A1_9AGAR|nr:hypothetical protein B0H15DRAFT_942376 [Mycena belliae]